MALTVIDSVAIDHLTGGPRTLQLCLGDLTALSPADAVDFICVSALPGDYSPFPGSLIGALANAGVSVQQQSQNKAADYEPTMPCWVSQDVSSAGLNFARFILFEPTSGQAEALVPTIYRALSCFKDGNYTSIALPMVCTGSGGGDLATILRQLFFSGAHFASQAWDLETVKLVVYNPAHLALATVIFAEAQMGYLNPPLAPPTYRALGPKLKASMAGLAIPAGMTQRQYDYVRAYTGNSIYKGVNATLRAGSLTSADYIYWQPTIEAISSGLAALPDYVGATQRGTVLTQPVIDQYQVGANVVELAFTSSSWDKPWGGNVLLYIASLTGKNVQAISVFSTEDEILYDAGLIEHVISVDGPVKSYSYSFTTNQVVTNWCQI